MKKIITLVIICLIIQYSFGQNRNDFYTSFSETGSIQHTLNFDDNGKVRIGSIRRHMSPFYVVFGKYESRKDTIFIKMNKINFIDLPKVKNFGLDYFSDKELTLYKNKSELIDKENRTVYVSSRKLYSNRIKRKSIAFINGKKYLYERWVTDGYGLIRREPKKNKKFEKAFAEVLKNIDDYKTEVIRGLTAYQRFGLIGINGVNIIEKTKQNNV